MPHLKVSLREMARLPEISETRHCGTDVFVHVSAVERAGMRGLNDGQKITYELVKDRKSGKMSADNLQA